MNTIRADLFKTLRKLQANSSPQISLDESSGQIKLQIHHEYVRNSDEAETTMDTAKKMQHIINKLETC